ncbi:hypothetical protein M9H77_31309 [Catharanthus roseus]|uniref:Uncharacterized protein n=1 Tax=Catharanthus roseus TaxID=4058 RepID=A0ACC0A2D1_CATRO|nr:hypothetical protein M9H77_31309 [Catharanthus roseus]
MTSHVEKEADRGEGVDWVFVDHPSYHRPETPYGDIHGAFGDNQFRFTLLCHAGLVPVLLAVKYRLYGVYKDAQSENEGYGFQFIHWEWDLLKGHMTNGTLAYEIWMMELVCVTVIFCFHRRLRKPLEGTVFVGKKHFFPVVAIAPSYLAFSCSFVASISLFSIVGMLINPRLIVSRLRGCCPLVVGPEVLLCPKYNRTNERISCYFIGSEGGIGQTGVARESTVGTLISALSRAGRKGPEMDFNLALVRVSALLVEISVLAFPLDISFSRLGSLILPFPKATDRTFLVRLPGVEWGKGQELLGKIS